MKIQRVMAIAVLGMPAVLMGCNQGTSGGPATPAKPETTVSITVPDTEDTETAITDEAKEMWEEYTASMNAQWEQFKERFTELQERAAEAEGQVRADLETRVEEARVKMDEVGARLEELRLASADRWEELKEGLSNAFDELKAVFE